MSVENDRWADAEVQALLNIYATEDIQGHPDFDGTKRNMKIFSCISAHLAELGINHSAKQCREKIKKLKQDYKRIKDHNSQSGSERKKSKWYDLLDGIFNQRQAYVGDAGMKVTVGHLDMNSNMTLPTKTDSEAIAPYFHDAGNTEDAHMMYVTSRPTSSSSHPSSPPPVRPGKRKRSNVSVLTLVRDMMEQMEEDRRQSHARFQSLLDMLREQSQRVAEEREQMRAEAAETRRQQAAFMEGILLTMNKLVTGAKSMRDPMMKAEKEDHGRSHSYLQSLVDMLKEQAQREMEEREQLRAEAAEARRQQAVFMEGILLTMNRLVAGTKGTRDPEVD